MTIKEVEATLGITRANVRYYEKEGLLFPKRNPINDYRDYSDQDVEALRRILFLRNLEIPIETIRQLMQGNIDMKEVLGSQIGMLEEEQKKTEQARLLCKNLLSEGTATFWEFAVPDSAVPEKKKDFMDTLSELWMFWDKLVVWGFFAVQILYTVIVYPLLPAEIPISWAGGTVTEYRGKWFFFAYLGFSMLFLYGMRTVLYSRVVGGMRCYLDELNAAATVGAIGVGFSAQVYTVLFLQGFGIGLDAFQMICMCGYALTILLIFLYRRLHKKQEIYTQAGKGGRKG